MKLNNIVEQLTNDDIKTILKKYDYNSTFFASIKSKKISVSLEQNLYVAYKGVDECVLPFDISHGEVVKYFGCTLDNRFTQPKKCEAFKIDRCKITTEDFVIRSNASEYSITDCTNGSRLVIENYESDAHGKTYILFTDLDSISKIDIKLPLAKYKDLVIRNCLSIKSFSDIECHEQVSNYDIRNIGVRSFKGFTTQVSNILTIHNIFNNYLYVDELKVNNLDLTLFDIYDNIITLLMNEHCNNIILFSEVSSENNINVIDIMNHYLHKYDKNIRKDYIMDCALELIDAGFEKAAEL